MVQNIKKYLIIFGIGIIGVLAILIYSGFNALINYCNAFFVTGGIIVFIGGLSFVSYNGAFDIFSYSGHCFVNMFRPNMDKKFKTMGDYVEFKNEKRVGKNLNFLPYIIVGILFVGIAFIIWLFL